MSANSYLRVHLRAVRDNAAGVLKEIGPRARLFPVLKGNAYGLGVIPVAKILGEFPEVDTFAVSHVAEGLELRQAGFRQKILVMSLPPADLAEPAARAGLVLPLASFYQFPLFKALAEKLGRKIEVSLKLDTGLHRIGFCPEEAQQLIDSLDAFRNVLALHGTFSHFSRESRDILSAEEERFGAFLLRLRAAGIPTGVCHLSSSAPLEAGFGLGLDAVRVGRRLYLDNPVQPTGRIREAFTLRAFLTDIRARRAGEPIGYGGSIVPERDTRVGILSVGYGDGLDPALARAHAPVLVNGRRVPLLACCMDQSFVDLGDAPAAPGDEVTLFGYSPDGSLLSSQEVAGLIGCEGVDLTSRLTPRVERVYDYS